MNNDILEYFTEFDDKLTEAVTSDGKIGYYCNDSHVKEYDNGDHVYSYEADLIYSIWATANPNDPNNNYGAMVGVEATNEIWQASPQTWTDPASWDNRFDAKAWVQFCKLGEYDDEISDDSISDDEIKQFFGLSDRELESLIEDIKYDAIKIVEEEI